MLVSQNTKLCGTDFVMKKHRNSPHFISEQSKIPTIKNYSESNNTKIIPIVFHIIHDGNQIGDTVNLSSAGTIEVEASIESIIPVHK